MAFGEVFQAMLQDTKNKAQIAADLDPGDYQEFMLEEHGFWLGKHDFDPITHWIDWAPPGCKVWHCGGCGYLWNEKFPTCPHCKEPQPGL